MAEEKSKKRTVAGKVISNKMDKTIVVLVERLVKHPVFGKRVRKSTKLHAHDANNECNIGDEVLVTESKPWSKTKSWVLSRVTKKAIEAA